MPEAALHRFLTGCSGFTADGLSWVKFSLSVLIFTQRCA
jgi:hypothetical protein